LKMFVHAFVIIQMPFYIKLRTSIVLLETFIILYRFKKCTHL